MAFYYLQYPSPHATPYDEEYPTRSIENLSHAYHSMLKGMTDEGWYLTDIWTMSESRRNEYMANIRAIVKSVFDYAALALTTYRDSGTPAIAEPDENTVATPWIWIPDVLLQQNLFRAYDQGLKICYFIYYQWKTREDPLNIQEAIRELLVAWPLMDTTIDLQTESGQTIRMYPSWKNVDLDL